METDERVVSCEWCGRPILRNRIDRRFCGKDCNQAYYVEERRRAMVAWRVQQREDFLKAMRDRADRQGIDVVSAIALDATTAPGGRP
jgi:hypothetical protein